MNIGIGICVAAVELPLDELLPDDAPPAPPPPPPWPPPPPPLDLLDELFDPDEPLEVMDPPPEVVDPPPERELPPDELEPLLPDDEFDEEELLEEDVDCEEPGEPPAPPWPPEDDELVSEATAGGTTSDAGSGCSTHTAARRSPPIRSRAARANCASATSARPL
ncbi:MAG TPA: hypothetical protein VHB99_15590 [Pirellulales bacterium]|nr:hypothetical protein [Pirellulales bacterium]